MRTPITKNNSLNPQAVCVTGSPPDASTVTVISRRPNPREIRSDITVVSDCVDKVLMVPVEWRSIRLRMPPVTETLHLTELAS